MFLRPKNLTWGFTGYEQILSAFFTQNGSISMHLVGLSRNLLQFCPPDRISCPPDQNEKGRLRESPESERAPCPKCLHQNEAAHTKMPRSHHKTLSKQSAHLPFRRWRVPYPRRKDVILVERSAIQQEEAITRQGETISWPSSMRLARWSSGSSETRGQPVNMEGRTGQRQSRSLCDESRLEMTGATEDDRLQLKK